jgi:hypothetical protein
MAGYSNLSGLAFPDFMDTVNRVHVKGDMLVDDLAAVKSLYRVESIPAHTGSQRIYDEYDTETYARFKAEGQDASKVRAIKGWSKTMTKRRFAAEIDISYEMRNEGKDQAIVNELTNLAKYGPQRMALDLTHRFTFATSTSYVDMDGETVDVSMGSTTPTSLVDATQDLTGSSSTYSSVITGTPAFSKGGFQIARERANTQTLSNFGEKRVINYDTVVTGDDPETVDSVRTFLRSTTDPSQNNPGVVNTYAGIAKHVILPRLATDATGAYDSTKTKWWFYVASHDAHLYLGIWEPANVSTPTSTNNGADIHNDDWTFETRIGYGICIVSARGVIGSCP